LGSGNLWYEGEWKDGLKHGYGKQYYDDGKPVSGETVACYASKLVSGETVACYASKLVSGETVACYASKIKYEGEWKCGKIHG
jgi:antitoxin component YwqK of YwqJK toxin-antitoxin module